MKDRALSIVRGVIRDKFSGGQTAWYGTLGNDDDQLGVAIHYMDQDSLAQDPIREYIDRWTNHDTANAGDWQLRIVFRNLDLVDSAECERLTSELAALRSQLETTTDPQESKQLLDAIAAVSRRMKSLGCG